MSYYISDKTWEVVNTLFPNIQSKKEAYSIFFQRDLNTNQWVSTPVPVSFTREQTTYLADRNGFNRRVSDSSTEQYKLSFSNNTFVRTGDAFMLDSNGMLVNGGCRIKSHAEYSSSKKASRLEGFLMIEVPNSVILVIDQARKRNISAQIKLATGLELDSIQQGIVKKAYFCNTMYTRLNRKNLGMPEYTSYIITHRKNLDNISCIIRSYSNRIGLDKQSVYRALYLIYMQDKTTGLEFINKFYTSQEFEELRDAIICNKYQDSPTMNLLLATAYMDSHGKDPGMTYIRNYYSEES